MAGRQSWLDEKTQVPQIDQYAQKLTSFATAMADGRIDDGELREQEQRLTRLMRDIEPLLDDALHAKVTQLLCELTAYDVMQVLHSLGTARPQTTFRG